MNSAVGRAKIGPSIVRHKKSRGNRRAAYRRMELWLSILSPVVLLAIWELIGLLQLMDLRYFPKPSTIAVSLWDLLLGDLWIDFKASIFRIVCGFILGSVPALVLGMAMGLSRPLRFAINPMIYSTYPIPKIAILPLVILIFGLGELSKIVVVAIGAFYLVLINTVAGVISIDNIYFDVAKNFCVRRRDLYLRVILPAALPSMITGLKLALGVSLLLIVAAEMLGANRGIGHLIWESWQTFTVPRMYVGLIIISALGYLLSVVADQIEKILLPWRD
jgi:NitT/TauT family transport system permease protein